MTRNRHNRRAMTSVFLRFARFGLALAFPFIVLGAGGCADTANMIDDDDELSWGQPIEGDFPTVLDRARGVVLNEFPLGFDPDRTKQEDGDLWTVWRIDESVFYRGTVRRRVRVKVADAGAGKVRVGVAMVQQINDNIDNPTVVAEAKWVRKQRLPEEELRIRDRIEQSWRHFEPSAQWKEKHRDERRKGLRPDLVDATEDVTLEDHKKDTIGTPPKITGQDEYGAGKTDEASHLRKKKKPEDE